MLKLVLSSRVSLLLPILVGLVAISIDLYTRPTFPGHITYILMALAGMLQSKKRIYVLLAIIAAGLTTVVGIISTETPNLFFIPIDRLSTLISVTILFLACHISHPEGSHNKNELLADHQKHAMILDSAREGIYGLDLNGNITFANHTAARLLGYEKQELLGKPMHAMVHHTKPDGGEFPIHECLIYATLTDGMSHRVDDEVLWHKDGNSFPVSYSTTPMMDRDTIVGAVIVFTDISGDIKIRKKLNQQALKLKHITLASDKHNLVTVTDLQGKITYINESYCIKSGYTKSELIGQNIDITWSGKQFNDASKELFNSLSCGEIWQGVFKKIAKDGSFFWVRSTVVPCMCENNRPYEYIFIHTDITDQVNNIIDLKKARNLAEQSSKAKSDFISSMSHELRTPLNAINGFSYMIQEASLGPLDDRYKEYGHFIHSSGKHLLSLIDDILDVSRVELGVLEIHKVELSAFQIATSCKIMVLDRAHKAGVSLTFDIPAYLPHLWADPLRIKQILINIIGNAIKFTPKGGRISLTGKTSGKGDIVLSIKDTGIGIAKSDIPKVLEKFGQVRGDSHNTHEGIGLGIPLSIFYMELHGGTLEIDSTLGIGTTVTLTFPGGNTPNDSICVRADRFE